MGGPDGHFEEFHTRALIGLRFALMRTTTMPPSEGRGAVIACVAAYFLVSFNFGISISVLGPMASILAHQANCTEADLAPGDFACERHSSINLSVSRSCNSARRVGPWHDCGRHTVGVDHGPIARPCGFGLFACRAGEDTARMDGSTIMRLVELSRFFPQAVGFSLMPLCRSVSSLTLVYGAISLTFNMVNTGVNCLAMWMLPPSKPDLPVSIGFVLNGCR